MDKKTIDKIVWWIPIKKYRNYIRNYMSYYFDSKKIKYKINSKIYIKYNKDKYFETRLNYIIHLSKLFNYKRSYTGNYMLDEITPHYFNNIIFYSNFAEVEKNIIKIYDLDLIKRIFYMFDDEYSKDIYLLGLINRMLNFQVSKGIMFNLYYSHIFNFFHKLSDSIIDSFDLNGEKWNLFDFSLINGINSQIKIYSRSQYEIFTNFFLEQYRYKDKLFAQEGDYVIDAGGYIGDTSIYFANLVGNNGKVFSFEFIPENIAIYKKNLDINPHLKDIISIVQNPLYDVSNKKVKVLLEGPGSKIVKDYDNNFTYEYNTITIDDFVINNNIKKIDLIKMDIEGSEQKALNGAINTIKRFRPKLAICVYHEKNDYYEVPFLLKKLLKDYNYKYYFDHFTLGIGESVIFCKPNSNM